MLIKKSNIKIISTWICIDNTLTIKSKLIYLSIMLLFILLSQSDTFIATGGEIHISPVPRPWKLQCVDVTAALL